MATISHLNIDEAYTNTAGIKANTITDKLNDEVIPKLETVTRITNEINWTFNNDIKPIVQTNKIEIDKINTIIKEDILPATTDFIELYEIIIIRILLSRLMIFLNHIFHWYSYMIQTVDDNCEDIIYIIVLSENNDKNTYNVRRKEFKAK